MVVVVDHDKVAELQVAGGTGGLAGDALHGAAVTEEAICVVVAQIVARLVEDTGGVSLGDGQTDGVGETLTERAGRHLDTGSVVSFGVTGADAVNGLEWSMLEYYAWRTPRGTYAERLEVVHADGVTEQVEESILEHATVAVAGGLGQWQAGWQRQRKSYERTKRSLFSQSGFFGLKVMNLLKRT